MGSILISVPDFPDAELIYDENETRQILKFFWPHRTREVEQTGIDNHARRLAQSALVAAIDGSYALGFIEATFRSSVRPGGDLKSLASKLGRQFAKHWWKHATRRDLDDIRIYECIRVEISRQLKPRLDEWANGIALKRSGMHFYAVSGHTDVAWS